jgi:hypothetical protein
LSSPHVGKPIPVLDSRNRKVVFFKRHSLSLSS